MKRSELKQLIKEAISDLAKRDFPNEQNAVVKSYLDKLREFERNNTDDLDDWKNLATAVGLYEKELISKIKGSLNESVEEKVPTQASSLTEKEKKKLGVQLPEDAEDEVGSFYIVEKPGTKSTLEDIMFECPDVAYFANQVRGGLKLEDIKGVFVKEAKAKKLAEKLLAERDKKKDEVKQAAEAYKKMKEETLAKVQEYMKNKKATKDVVDELKDLTDK